MIHFLCGTHVEEQTFKYMFPSQKYKALHFVFSLAEILFNILRINGMVRLPNEDIITAEMNMRGRQIQKKHFLCIAY